MNFLKWGFLHLSKGEIVCKDNNLYFINNSFEILIPFQKISTLYLEDGITITSAAINLAAKKNLNIFWGNNSCSGYFVSGIPIVKHNKNIILQTKNFYENKKEIAVKLFKIFLNSSFDENLSIDSIRGIEANEMKSLYLNLSNKYNICWVHRMINCEWKTLDLINKAITTYYRCLYGLSQSVILNCGFSTSIGFIHAGTSLCFVYDIADLWKRKYIENVFEIVKNNTNEQSTIKEIRKFCNKMFFLDNLHQKTYNILKDLFNGYNNNKKQENIKNIIKEDDLF